MASFKKKWWKYRAACSRGEKPKCKYQGGCGYPLWRIRRRACRNGAQISQSVNGNQSPNIIAGGNVSVTYVNEEKLSQRKAIEEEKQDASQQESGGQVQSGESAAEASEQGGIKETEEAP
nr:hypothetical protein [Candidatus Electrothrix aestuarii]